MRVLAGPDNWSFFTEFWRKGLQGTDVLFFSEGGAGIQFDWGCSTFADLLRQLPPGWEPDLVVWWFPEYQPVLPGIEDCPFPTMAVISDWQVATDSLFEMARHFDLVATDRMGVRLLGEDLAFDAPLYGYDPSSHFVLENVPKLFDVTHVGGLYPLLHDQRVRALVQTAEGLAGEYRVKYFSGIHGDNYTWLVNASRITINYTLRGEMNMRCFEAPACGSLLFCEDDNLSLRQILEEGRHYVGFNQQNLLEKLRYYLEHEDQRASLAAAGHRAIQPYSYAHQANALLQQALARIQKRQRSRTSLCDYWAGIYDQIKLPRLAYSQKSCDVNQRGCIAAQLGEKTGEKAYLQEAVAHFEQALSQGALAHLSLAFTLLRLDERAAAVHRLLEARHQPFREVCFYPRKLQTFHLQWERFPWLREQLVRWQIAELLSQLLPQRCEEFCREALAHRDDLPTTWFRLGACLQDVNCHKKAVQLAPYFLEARLAWLRLQPDDRLERDNLALSQCFADAGWLQQPHGDFEWLQPGQPLSGYLWEREGNVLEYFNSTFSEESRRRFLQMEELPRRSTLSISQLIHELVAEMPAEEVFLSVDPGFPLLSGSLGNPDKLCLSETDRPVGVYWGDGDLSRGRIVLVNESNQENRRQWGPEFEVLRDQRTVASDHPTWWNGITVLRRRH